MPLENVFPPDYDHQLVEVTIEGRICSARRGVDGVLRLERLYSTDPRDYLDMRFKPDTVLDW